MPYKTNDELARIFFEMASLLAIAGVDWKPAAYRKAASSIVSLDKDIRKIYKDGGLKALDAIPGVGEGIAEKIAQYLKTGKIEQYERLRGTRKADLSQIASVQSMGPKKATCLYQELGIKTIADLEKAAKAHKISKLPGFKEKSEQDILAGIELHRARGPRKPLAEAKSIAYYLINALNKTKLSGKIIAAGSIRRGKETIGDIDLLATSRKPKELMKAFTTLLQVKRVLAKGPTKSMVILKNNIQADIRVVPPESWGAALLYFTGSKQYNIGMRKIAIRKGYKLNEYGLFDRKTDKRLAGKTEKEIYAKLGLNYKKPKQRK